MLNLINKNKITLSLFRNLPINHKITIAQYFSLNNTLWKCPEKSPKDSLELDEFYHKHIGFYDKEYGEYLFGRVDIPINDLINKVMSSYEFKDNKLKSWSDYHNYIMENFEVPNYIKLCPVLIAINNPKCEVVEDGWMRLHDYYRKGIKVIPCVYHFFITNYSLMTI